MCSVQKWMKILELKTVFEDTSIEQKNMVLLQNVISKSIAQFLLEVTWKRDMGAIKFELHIS